MHVFCSFGVRPLYFVIFSVWRLSYCKSCTCEFSWLAVCDGASFGFWQTKLFHAWGCPKSCFFEFVVARDMQSHISGVKMMFFGTAFGGTHIHTHVCICNFCWLSKQTVLTQVDFAIQGATGSSRDVCCGPSWAGLATFFMPWGSPGPHFAYVLVPLFSISIVQ